MYFMVYASFTGFPALKKLQDAVFLLWVQVKQWNPIQEGGFEQHINEFQGLSDAKTWHYHGNNHLIHHLNNRLRKK